MEESSNSTQQYSSRIPLVLPEDILFQILTHLDVRTLIEKKVISRQWRTICTNAINSKQTLQTKKVFQSKQELDRVINKYMGVAVVDVGTAPDDAEEASKTTTGAGWSRLFCSGYCTSDDDIEDIACTYGWPIGKWDVSQLDDFSGTFKLFFTFNEDISTWNVSNAIRMDEMFYGTDQFNQDISCWDTSQVVTMNQMFTNASSFNQNISTWNTSNVITMIEMFQGATTFNQNLSLWDTRNVLSMKDMFQNATCFSQDIDSSWETWDTSKF